VDPQQVRDWAQKYYGSLAARPLAPRKPRTEPEQTGMRRVDVKAPAEQAYVALAFKTPALTPQGLDDPSDPAGVDALALTVLAAVLDGYSGARLERALTQPQDHVADSAGAYAGFTARGPQSFVLYGVPAKGKTAAQVEAALREQVARVARDGVKPQELVRVKNQWIAAEVFKLDSLFNQARILGVSWINGFPLGADQRLMARLRNVSAEQVQSVAARYFGDDALTVATLLPQPLDKTRKPRPAAAGARH
jgi:zinc protease